MDWVNDFQLFLFDFDGLLVNTEELHYQAYQIMCANRGEPLPWDFNRYCQAAHYHSDALKVEILQACPGLKKQVQDDWQILYREKQQAIQKLLSDGAATLMPGIIPLLTLLAEKNIKRAVVTHSPDELVKIIRSKHPILNTIPNWITRHYYTHPKPHSECYLKAIEMLSEPNDQIIGFEDTPRGLTSLLGTPAKPILICKAEYPEIPKFIKQGVLRFKSFEELLNRKKLT